nr:MAG TPA: hypothetical protein [Caudoviricetes sp.]
MAVLTCSLHIVVCHHFLCQLFHEVYLYYYLYVFQTFYLSILTPLCKAELGL